MTVSTFEAARKVCQMGNWDVTNLKLQKILYITHMIFLGRHGEPLIPDCFEAWDYGPVVPALYHKVKMYGNQPVGKWWLSCPKDIDPESKEARALEEACGHLLPKSPGELVALTHQEGGAWEKNYVPGAKGIKIPDTDIIAEYRGIVGGQ